MTKYSLIIPVYDRPEELRELLESLVAQDISSEIEMSFEVLVIEDGSRESAEDVCQSFSHKLPLHYFYKENTGPGPSRNYGIEKAEGDYFIFFDSDCIIPPAYLKTMHHQVQQYRLDAFGGPDASHQSFTTLQKSINYAMTSFLSTGGIRGKKKHLGTYQARSFNMGFSRQVYEATQGFGTMRVSEDIDLSIRIRETGFKLQLVPEAFVYHKRRSSFTDFFRQAHSFGKGRASIVKRHPSQFKWVHLFPSLWLLFLVSMFPMFWIWEGLAQLQLFTILLYATLIFSDSIASNRNFLVGLLSIPAVFIQLGGYGSGFLKGIFAYQPTQQKFSSDNRPQIKT